MDGQSAGPQAGANALAAARLTPCAGNRGAAGGFAAVNRAALAVLPKLLARWLPDGKAVNGEWVALNPKRNDRRPGSFGINLKTGRWADFATGDKGGGFARSLPAGPVSGRGGAKPRDNVGGLAMTARLLR